MVAGRTDGQLPAETGRRGRIRAVCAIAVERAAERAGSPVWTLASRTTTMAGMPLILSGLIGVFSLLVNLRDAGIRQTETLTELKQQSISSANDNKERDKVVNRLLTEVAVIKARMESR